MKTNFERYYMKVKVWTSLSSIYWSLQKAEYVGEYRGISNLHLLQMFCSDSLYLTRTMIHHHFLHVLVGCDVIHFQLVPWAGQRLIRVSAKERPVNWENTWQCSCRDCFGEVIMVSDLWPDINLLLSLLFQVKDGGSNSSHEL